MAFDYGLDKRIVGVQFGGQYLTISLLSRSNPGSENAGAPFIELHKQKSTFKVIYDKTESSKTDPPPLWYVWYPAQTAFTVLIGGGFGYVTWGSLTLEDALKGITVMGYGKAVYGEGRIAPVRNVYNTTVLYWPPNNAFTPSSDQLYFANADEAQAYADFFNSGAPDGVARVSVGSSSNDKVKTFTRDLVVQLGQIPVEISADINLIGDIKGISLRVYQKIKVKPAPKAPITPKTFEKSSADSAVAAHGGASVYTIKVTRDTADPVPPNKTKLLILDISPTT